MRRSVAKELRRAENLSIKSDSKSLLIRAIVELVQTGADGHRSQAKRKLRMMARGLRFDGHNLKRVSQLDPSAREIGDFCIEAYRAMFVPLLLAEYPKRVIEVWVNGFGRCLLLKARLSPWAKPGAIADIIIQTLNNHRIQCLAMPLHLEQEMVRVANLASTVVTSSYVPKAAPICLDAGLLGESFCSKGAKACKWPHGCLFGGADCESKSAHSVSVCQSVDGLSTTSSRLLEKAQQSRGKGNKGNKSWTNKRKGNKNNRENDTD